jgi:hypothetical protein
MAIMPYQFGVTNMPNIYFVKTVADAKVLGLAVESDGQWVGTSYAVSGKGGDSAPTTVAGLEESLDSGAVPLPSSLFLLLAGMDKDTLIEQFADEGDVYFEHAVAV